MTVEQADFTSALAQNKEKLLNVGPADLENVMKHYNVSPEDVSNMVRNIRDWLKKQPHLPEDKLRDQQIVGHLMFRGYSVEKVKRSLDDIFTARHRMPDLLCERDPLQPNLAEYMKKGYWYVVPKKTPEDHRITLFRFIPASNVSASTVIKVAFMYAEYRIWNEASLADRWILDLENVGMQHVMQFTPVMISNIIFYIMACFGTRVKSVHIINIPSYAVAIVNLFKMMMKTKLGDRVFMCTKEEMVKLFPKDCLPEEFGGTGGNLQDIADEWCKTIQSDAWRQYFIEQNSVFTDESKRLTPSTTDALFGTEGSFRKLCLD